MGRMLGAFDGSEELERADLNKCPDCGCFFPQLKCPICGRECPEHMRAGNRAAVKKKKKKGSSSSRNVTFIDWYHRWWFIILMLFFMPIVGIILLVTSPHKRSAKIAVIVAAVAYSLLTTVGIGTVVNTVTGLMEKPVDTSLTYDEYVTACRSITAEEFYRSSNGYEDEFVTFTLKVKYRFTDADGGRFATYYLCDGGDGTFEVLVRVCNEDTPNYIIGDNVTVYGEGAGEVSVLDGQTYEYHTGHCLNAAYMEISE